MSDGVDVLGTPTLSAYVRLKHLVSLFTLVESMLVSNPLAEVDAKVLFFSFWCFDFLSGSYVM